MADSKTIVYVEDEAEMIELVKLVLERTGFCVIGATSGNIGLQAIRDHKPDLVMLDLMLPGMDGWEVHRRMRAEVELKDIPVVIVTAKAQSIDKVLAVQVAHVNAYVVKPFGPQELVQAVEKVLQQAAETLAAGKEATAGV